LVTLCQCGCGHPAPVATRNFISSGIVKGQPLRFIRGHNARVAVPWWKGDDVGYNALHAYLRKHYPKSGFCDECSKQKPTEYARIKGREYSRDRMDYRELCKACHNLYDEVGGSRWQDTITARTVAGDSPDCACGCGSKTEWSSKKASWLRFADGHYTGRARRAVQMGR
jgi:hypothetical protein